MALAAGNPLPVVWRAFYFDGSPFYVAPVPNDADLASGSWDDTDESRSEIENCIEWLRHLDPDGKRWS